MSGHSFQFTPGGQIVSVDSLRTDASEEIIGADPNLFRGPDRTSVVAPQKRIRSVASKSFDVVKAAKARRRELRREIARLRKLEIELGELDRLLAAAENKPRAVVRDITAAKRG